MKKIMLPNFDNNHQFFGGSYYLNGVSFPGFRVNLMAEHLLESDLSVPIDDFSVPSNEGNFIISMATIAHKLLLNQPVFVGCYGGRGRTGLALASLAHLTGEPDPIVWLQSNYLLDSPETNQQKEFVMSLPCGLLNSSKQITAWSGHNKTDKGAHHVRPF